VPAPTSKTLEPAGISRAISSIHLLQIFLNAATYDNQKIMWATLMHLAFVLSAFSLALVDRVAAATKLGKRPE